MLLDAYNNDTFLILKKVPYDSYRRQHERRSGKDNTGG